MKDNQEQAPLVHSENSKPDSSEPHLRGSQSERLILELEQVEETLREYERVVEGLDEMIMVVDRDYRYLIANRAFLHYRGLERKQVIGHYVREFQSAEVFEEIVKPRLDECFEGRVVRYSLRFTYPKVGERDLLCSYFPIEGPGGVDRVACILQDVTERKRAEAESRASHQLLHTVVEEIPDVIFVKDLQGRYQLINSAGARVLGKSVDEIIGKDDSVFISGYAAREIMRRDGEILTSGVSQTFEETIAAAGAPRTYLTSKSVRRDSEGRPSGVIGIARDITASKQVEEALREAEERYRSIFENAGEGIFQTSLDGQYIAANPELARIHGFESPEELIRSRKDITREVYVDPICRDEFKRRLEKDGIVREFEHEIFRRDGSRIWISVNARGVRNEQGTILYYEGTTQDITERKRAEARSAAFANLARKLGGARVPLEAARIIVDSADQMFGWDSCTFDIYEPELDLIHNALNIDTINGQRKHVPPSVEARPPTARGRYVIERGALLTLRDAPYKFDEDSLRFGDQDRPSASIMSVPIRRAAEVIGILSIQSYQPYCYDHEALNDLQSLADHCGEALNRIRAEASLKESEDRFGQMAAQFEDLVWFADRDITKILYVNPAYEKIFSRPRGTLYERLDSFVDAVHPDDRAGIERVLEDQRNGHHQTFEYRVVHPDGSIRWLQRRSFPIRNNEGEVYLIAEIGQDITEQKRVEHELRESEAMFSTAFHSSPAPLIITSLDDGCFVNVNDAFLRTFEYERAEVIGETVASLNIYIHANDRSGLKDELRKKRELRGYDSQARTKSGRVLDLWVFVEPIKLNGRECLLSTAYDVTERKSVEDALRVSEERYRDLVENSRELICTHDLDGKILSANRAAAKVLGYALDEFVGQGNVRDILAPEVRQQFNEYMDRLCKNGATGGTMLVQTKSGERRVWEYYNSLRTEGVADPIVRGMARDITEQRRAEESLRLFRNLIDQSNDAIEVIDPATLRFIDCNEIAYRSLGYSREEFLSLTIFDVDPLLDRSNIAASDEAGVATFEGIHQRKDGTTFPVEVNVKLVRLERNYRLAVVRDITRRKRAEEELRKSEERYRELFENARDAIYVHDLGGRYISVNQAAEKLLGRSRPEIIGKHYSNFVAPSDLKHVRTNLCRKMDDESHTVYEVNVVNRAGRRIPVEVSSRLIFEQGVRVGVQGTARDITDRKRAQEALRSYSQRLIVAQEAERQKIARELHDEIGQVLTAVRINLQSIQRSRAADGDASRLEESIAIVDEALGRVRELSIELRPALLDDLGLSAALRWYVDRYAQRTGIIAEVVNGFPEDLRLPRDLETVCFRITQEALTNVARHAQAVSVSVQLERARDKILLTVIDDGVGFDIEQLKNSQTAASSLGLRGMKERALAVGGEIVIDSGHDRGTRICASFRFNRIRP